MHLTPLPCWLSALPRIKHEAKQIKNATFYSGLTSLKAKVFHYIPACSHQGLHGRGTGITVAKGNDLKPLQWKPTKKGAWKSLSRKARRGAEINTTCQFQGECYNYTKISTGNAVTLLESQNRASPDMLLLPTAAVWVLSTARGTHRY